MSSRVSIVLGLLVGVIAAGTWIGLRGGVSEATFAKIKTGMTTTEVETIVGKPGKLESANTPFAAYSWNAGSHLVAVFTKDDKVVETAWAKKKDVAAEAGTYFSLRLHHKRAAHDVEKLQNEIRKAGLR